MFGDSLNFAIAVCAGFGYLFFSLTLKFPKVVKIFFALCGSYLIGYGLFIQAAGPYQWIAIVAYILPFIAVRIFKSESKA